MRKENIPFNWKILHLDVVFCFLNNYTDIDEKACTISGFPIWNCKLLQIIMILFIYHFLQTTTRNSNGKLETMQLQIRKWHRYDKCKLFYSLMICKSSYISSIFRPWKSNQTFTLILRNFALTERKSRKNLSAGIDNWAKWSNCYIIFQAHDYKNSAWNSKIAKNKTWNSVTNYL